MKPALIGPAVGIFLACVLASGKHAVATGTRAAPAHATYRAAAGS